MCKILREIGGLSALELLVPYSSLITIYNQLLKPSLSVLAQIFQVSTNVMRERLKYLELNFVDDSNSRWGVILMIYNEDIGEYYEANWNWEII